MSKSWNPSGSQASTPILSEKRLMSSQLWLSNLAEQDLALGRCWHHWWIPALNHAGVGGGGSYFPNQVSWKPPEAQCFNLLNTCILSPKHSGQLESPDPSPGERLQYNVLYRSRCVVSLASWPGFDRHTWHSWEAHYVTENETLQCINWIKLIEWEAMEKRSRYVWGGHPFPGLIGIRFSWQS